jgi:hypothetical protein
LRAEQSLHLTNDFDEDAVEHRAIAVDQTLKALPTVDESPDTLLETNRKYNSITPQLEVSADAEPVWSSVLPVVEHIESDNEFASKLVSDDASPNVGSHIHATGKLFSARFLCRF